MAQDGKTFIMRKVEKSIKDIITAIEALKGEVVSMHVSHGRKRIEKIVGKIEKVYPSVFVVDAGSTHIPSKISYSFSDVLCGDVKIKKIPQ